MKHIVIDTNLLIAAGYSKSSASRQIVELCLAGRLQPAISSAVRGEYEHILRQALRRDDYRPQLERFIAHAEVVEPSNTPRVVPDDPEDDKLLAAAVAGRADALVSNDRHLLQLESYQGIPIVTPADFLASMETVE